MYFKYAIIFFILYYMNENFMPQDSSISAEYMQRSMCSIGSRTCKIVEVLIFLRQRFLTIQHSCVLQAFGLIAVNSSMQSNSRLGTNKQGPFYNIFEGWRSTSFYKSSRFQC